jgi:hypothetical protein
MNLGDAVVRSWKVIPIQVQVLKTGRNIFVRSFEFVQLGQTGMSSTSLEDAEGPRGPHQ